MKNILAAVLVLTILLGCSKEEFAISSFYACENGLIENATELEAALKGSWQLKEISCGFCSGEFPKKATKKVIVNFYPDNSFDVEDELAIVSEGNWSIISSQMNAKVVIEGDDTQYLSGSINLCDNQLYADLTPADGFGHLYLKIE